MLSNAYFLAKFRFDTAENEPAKNLQNFTKFANFARGAAGAPGAVSASSAQTQNGPAQTTSAQSMRSSIKHFGIWLMSAFHLERKLAVESKLAASKPSSELAFFEHPSDGRKREA